MYVIEDVTLPNNQYRMVLNDGQSVVVREVRPQNEAPYFSKVHGDFTPEIINAITNFSRLQVK